MLRNSILEHALSQWQSDPGLQIEDAYKWLFHATRGGEHAIKDEVVPRGWLEREWPTLSEPQPGEALWVPLRPDGSLGRLNLRPYRAKGGQPEPLLQAFVLSAQRFKSERKDFEEVWIALGEILKARTIEGIFYADWRTLNASMRPRGYPAIHHSPSYERARVPAYRVLTREEFEKLV